MSGLFFILYSFKKYTSCLLSLVYKERSFPFGRDDKNLKQIPRPSLTQYNNLNGEWGE